MRRGIITYINPDNEFVIKLLIHQLINKLQVFINKEDNNTKKLAKNYYVKDYYELAL